MNGVFTTESCSGRASCYILLFKLFCLKLNTHLGLHNVRISISLSSTSTSSPTGESSGAITYMEVSSPKITMTSSGIRPEGPA
jgi:hypothetical protein